MTAMTRPKASATDVGDRPLAIAPQPKKTSAKVPSDSAASCPQARAGRGGRPAARRATSMNGRSRAETSISVRRKAASFSSSVPSTSDGSSRPQWSVFVDPGNTGQVAARGRRP